MRAFYFFLTRFTISNDANIHYHGVKQLTKIERTNSLSIFETMLFFIHTRFNFYITVSKTLGI